jgi:hypothetical protein
VEIILIGTNCLRLLTSQSYSFISPKIPLQEQQDLFFTVSSIAIQLLRKQKQRQKLKLKLNVRLLENLAQNHVQRIGGHVVTLLDRISSVWSLPIHFCGRSPVQALQQMPGDKNPTAKAYNLFPMEDDSRVTLVVDSLKNLHMDKVLLLKEEQVLPISAEGPARKLIPHSP